MPESLVAALDELTEVFDKARVDDEFQDEFKRLSRDYSGRPSLLTEAERFGESIGARVFLKREDLNHTGSHKINNVLGQALLAQRMGKNRLIAETGAGQHGVATATRRGAVRHGMLHLHGRGGHPPSGPERSAHAPARCRGRTCLPRLRHAQGRDQRSSA